MPLNKPRIAVSTAFASNGLVAGTFMVRLPDIKSHLNLSNGNLGLSLFVLMVGVLISIKITGNLVAKFGSKTIAIPATLAMAFALSLVPLAGTWLMFSATLLLLGLTLAAQDISMNSHGIAVEHQFSARFMSSFHAVFSIGALIGGFIAGVLSQLSVSVRMNIFILAIFISALSLTLRNWWLPSHIDIHPREKGRKRKNFPKIFIALGILGFCGQVGEGAAGDWGGILSRDVFGASPFLSSLPYIFFSITMVLGRLFGDRIASQYRAASVLALGGYISGIGLISGLLVGNVVGAILGWALLGAGLSIVVPILFSESGRIARENYSDQIAPSEAVAKVSGLAYFGFMAGPPLIGNLSSLISLRWALLLPGVLAILLGVFARRLIKD